MPGSGCFERDSMTNCSKQSRWSKATKLSELRTVHRLRMLHPLVAAEHFLVPKGGCRHFCRDRKLVPASLPAEMAVEHRI